MKNKTIFGNIDVTERFFAQDSATTGWNKISTNVAISDDREGRFIKFDAIVYTNPFQNLKTNNFQQNTIARDSPALHFYD